MTNFPVQWTTSSLHQSLSDFTEGGELSNVEISEGSAISLRVAGAGDFQIYICVGEGQILTSALLWPRDMQEDPTAFESLMLRSHKTLLPLCALSIDVIDGQEFYELFGAMSLNASLEDILNEIRAIADSAMELARELGPRKLGKAK